MADADGLDFASLDALLDQALESDEEELNTLLGRLPEAQRNALVRLLEATDSQVLAKLSAAARSSITSDLAEPTSTPELSTSAGSWRLRHEIGHGGTGQVFFAERTGESSNKRTLLKDVRR
ncbi:MAG: hypothetical protein AAGL66_07055 [Pseudomonadota bacterium]